MAEVWGSLQVHPGYRDRNWVDYKHYLLFFHDEILEVVAKGHKIEKTDLTPSEAANEIIKRMNK